MIDSVITDFGKTIGFDEFKLDPDGLVSIAFNNDDVFSIETLEDGVLLSISVTERPWAILDSIKYLLELAANKHEEFMLQVMLKPEAIISVAVFITNSEVSVEVLKSCFDLLWMIRQDLLEKRR